MYQIMTDTSANLPTPLLAERKIGILPFTYRMEGKEYQCLDTERFDGHAFFDAIRKGVKVDTAQINPTMFEEAFRPVLEAGDDLIFVSMSSGISGSYQSSRLAVLELELAFPDRKIATVDTHGASLGEGFVALRGADLRDAGVPFEEAVAELEHMSKCMCQIFTVDDLMHLRRTGRLSNFSAIVGTMLMLKPLLKGDEEGRIVSFAKYRGRRKALQAIAKAYSEHVVDPESQIVGIAHADCPEDAQWLIDRINESKPPKEILNVMYEPVTGSHVGPDTLALFFLGGETVRTDKLVPDLREQLGLAEKVKAIPEKVKEIPGKVKELPDKVKELPEKVKEIPGKVKEHFPGKKE